MDCFRAPTPFLATSGRPLMPWSQWFREFKLFAVASGWDSWTEDRREALLLHCAGREARRLYFAAAKSARVDPNTTRGVDKTDTSESEVKTETETGAGSTASVESVSEVFLQLFPEKRALHTDRMLFRRCLQGDRTPAVYLAELQLLSSRCGFGDLQEQLMAEQFLEGCSDDRLRERLCRESALTTSRILEVADELQMAAERHRMVGGVSNGQTSSSKVEVAAVSAQRRVTKPSHCQNCGGSHTTGDPSCPAKWRKCHKCQTKGHYAKFCRDPSKTAKKAKEDKGCRGASSGY